jgi:hypothetical protein
MMEGEGYCTSPNCGQPTDETGPGALCAYHRDMQEGTIIGFDKEE